MSRHRHGKRKFRRSRSSLIWFLVITVVVVIVGAILGLGGGLINFLEKNADVLDTQYVPMDLDHRTMDKVKEQVKGMDPEKLEQLKRKFFDSQSKK